MQWVTSQSGLTDKKGLFLKTQSAQAPVHCVGCAGSWLLTLPSPLTQTTLRPACGPHLPGPTAQSSLQKWHWPYWFCGKAWGPPGHSSDNWSKTHSGPGQSCCSELARGQTRNSESLPRPLWTQGSWIESLVQLRVSSIKMWPWHLECTNKSCQCIKQGLHL